MRKLNRLPLMAFILGLGFMSTMLLSSFTSRPNLVTYHIVSDDGDRYKVTTSGDCIEGTTACSFETDLSPDTNDQILKTALDQADVEIMNGTFVPTP